MALTRALTLYSGSDATPVVDYTNDTDWPQTELATMANLGEASSGQWLLRDELGAIPDALGSRFLYGHNVVVCTVGSNTLWRGRIANQEHFRGRQKASRASEWTVTVEDANSHARGIIVDAWVRPEETDTTRMLALVSAYLNGSPRATTVLGTSRVITGSNTITLPAKTYSGVTPFEIMQELASNTDKEVFVTPDNELFYCGHDYTGFDSALRISDDPADANSTTFAPWDPRGTEFSRGILSALRVYTNVGTSTQSTQVTNSNAPAYDYWEDIYWDSESTTTVQSAARAQKMLDYRTTPDVSFSCAIGPLNGAQTNEIKAGMRIPFKARAANGGRLANGTFTGDSFLTTRIREIRWTFPAEDQYIAHLDLERPKRITPYSQGNQALTVGPTASPTLTLVQFDDFNRVVSSHFGSTDYGIGWLKSLYLGHGEVDVFFDGTTGIGEFYIEASFPGPTMTTAEGDGGPWVDSPEWTMRVRFRLVDFPRAMNIAIVNPLGGSLGVQVGGTSGDTFLISDVVDDTNAVGTTVFVEDVWYIVELHYEPGVILEAKVWQEGDSVPSAYQVYGAPDATVSSDSYLYLYPNEFAEERFVDLDYIYFFTSAGAAVRQQTPFQWEFHKAGTLTVATDVAEYFLTPYNCIIDSVVVHDSAFVTGTDVIVDVNANGTTIFTTQANRPHIAVSTNGGTSGYPDGGTAISPNRAITIDVDQIGSGVPGADLVVLIRGRYH